MGRGAVYVKRKDFKKAETLLKESLNLKELYITRMLLALAYLSQRKVSEAESVHLEGIKRKPKDSQRFKGYSAFLSDVGRDAETTSSNAERPPRRVAVLLIADN
jgi:Tfp pilus assembly protein PilF